MRSNFLALRRLYINLARVAGWVADFEGSEPTATGIKLMERTLLKFNEKLGLQLETSVLLPLHGPLGEDKIVDEFHSAKRIRSLRHFGSALS